ncbi:peptidase, M22 family [Treponema primitia ZAS-2]|uniref:Peptidase, M22 family n=1 Tax=Treponema primitia (strain ATCC BAA-887 / DSM 12427 / ZAS-2) TaxID=545694 RepID=F5YL16_TREPZ|nr:tRNA (adenosine(37)-N6)-threonylcarbamoyltransferase complex dimerization subunit type 1 TsaB [Treponema primitia]AEF86582.1 peptidase, M22 family [Treponema primitia ZAS-2]
MNILALDTSSQVLSAALSKGEDVWYFEVDGGLRHAELLMDVLDRLLGSAGLESGDIDLAACMKGPGSFTGLRIAFAAVKGLALALGIPMVSVPTLDCLAAPYASWPGLVIPALDAKKDRFFSALYREGERLGDFMDASPEEIAARIRALSGGDAQAGENVMITGPDGPLLYEKLKTAFGPGLFCDPGGKRGRARELLDIILKRGIIGSEEEYFSGPLYLRKSDAELSFGAK